MVVYVEGEMGKVKVGCIFLERPLQKCGMRFWWRGGRVHRLKGGGLLHTQMISGSVNQGWIRHNF